MKNIWGFIYICLLLTIISCGQFKSSKEKTDFNEIEDVFDNQIWQLDGFPDSILVNKSIDDQSVNESNYSYNIIFKGDSCQFVGTRESEWLKLKKINDKEFKAYHEGEDIQFWEIKFVSNNKLLAREIFKRPEKIEIGKYVSYHKVKKPLTLDSLNNLIAEKLFAGEYKTIYNDTLKLDEKVILTKNFEVKGIMGIEKFYFLVSDDCCYPVFNAFGFQSKKGISQNHLSFKFENDTLKLSANNPVFLNGDFDHYEISKPRIKLQKVK